VVVGPQDTSRVVTGLGALSLGLGAVQVLVPAPVSRVLGLDATPRTTSTMRAVGAQELGLGAGLLSGRATAAMLWSRFAGDLAHLGMLASALRDPKHERRRLLTGIAAVVGVAVVDLAAARSAHGSASGAQHASATVTIRRDPQTVYGYWRDLENLPTFMTHVRSVERTRDGLTHWVVDAPTGGTIEWDAEIVQDVPSEVIAWRSTPGADLDNAGVVRFVAAPGDRGTEVTVELEFSPPAGAVGALAAKLLGEHPEQQARDDLRRFKQVLEAGEVVRTDGSPDGLRSQRLLAQQAAQPHA
jgi:uncharacterized membrane protein